MNLPDNVSRALQPLFDRLPLDQALSQLVVSRGASPELVEELSKILREPGIAGRPVLAAGLWLYIDELDRSHTVSQQIEDATGSFWHGIMHRREGDFSNSHYWFRRVGKHPAMKQIADYDPHTFIDEVERHHTHPPSHLVEMQRREWQALFEWCARQR